MKTKKDDERPLYEQKGEEILEILYELTLPEANYVLTYVQEEIKKRAVIRHPNFY